LTILHEEDLRGSDDLDNRDSKIKETLWLVEEVGDCDTRPQYETESEASWTRAEEVEGENRKDNPKIPAMLGADRNGRPENHVGSIPREKGEEWPSATLMTFPCEKPGSTNISYNTFSNSQSIRGSSTPTKLVHNNAMFPKNRTH
jgi:hypothetical protein